MWVKVSVSVLKYWKNRCPSAFSWGKMWWYSPYCPLNWGISWTSLLSLFNFKWTLSEAIRRRAASSLVSSTIVTGLQSAPIIGLRPTIPTCRQAAGRSVLVPTFGIEIWTRICLHCTRTLRSCSSCDTNPRSQYWSIQDSTRSAGYCMSCWIVMILTHWGRGF